MIKESQCSKKVSKFKRKCIQQCDHKMLYSANANSSKGEIDAIQTQKGIHHPALNGG